MKCTGKITGFNVDFITGKQTITFEVNEDISADFEALRGLEKLSIKAVKYRKKRSLNANAYFHLLVGKIAETLGETATRRKNVLIAECQYLERIDEKPVTIDLDDSIDCYEIEWLHLIPTQRTFENSKGTIYRTHMVARGSHTYNTKEMAHLIDLTVEQAKELGIDTATPQELKEMTERWGVEFEKHNSK